MKFVVPIVMCVLLSAPSLKLLLQARRQGGGPEGWAGLFFLGAAAGMPMRMVGATLMQAGAESGPILNVAGHVGMGVSALALTVFTWKVFHPDSTRGRAVAMTLIASQVGTVGFGFVSGHIHVEESGAIVAINAMRVVPTVWACFESVRYWLRMRRRVALGVGDPVVANRFALWAIWTAAFAALPATALVLRVFVPMFVTHPEDPAVVEQVMTQLMGILRYVLASTGLVGLVALTLSFFPPDSYLARLRARAGADAAQAA